MVIGLDELDGYKARLVEGYRLDYQEGYQVRSVKRIGGYRDRVRLAMWSGYQARLAK